MTIDHMKPSENLEHQTGDLFLAHGVSDPISDFDTVLAEQPISPWREMAAYEALWQSDNASFKTIAEIFEKHPGATPSQLVSQEATEDILAELRPHFSKAEITEFGVRIHGALDYPKKLRDAIHPLAFFYFQGWWDLAESRKSVAVVGTREPSREGAARAKRLVKLLVAECYTIYSGLARGIDTVAHTTTLEEGGNTVAVIGTPITEYYPRENKEMQRLLAREQLVISQVPILRYARQTYKGNRFFFPERNATMSAFSQATIIVEAGETSGTLTQARAALNQGRKLFILDNCFQNPNLTWPAKYEAQGAIRVRDFDDIIQALTCRN